MASAYRALASSLTPPIAQLVADFAAPDICEYTLYCTKHRQGFLGVWYGCDECCQEFSGERPPLDRYKWVPMCFAIGQLEECDAVNMLGIRDCDCNLLHFRCNIGYYNECKNIRDMRIRLDNLRHMCVHST